MNIVNKICVCCCCSGWACQDACCIDYWHAVEACGFAQLEQGNCCWTIFAPICHTCSIGDFGSGISHCTNCVKYCLYACALKCCSPIDGCINCVLYAKDIFTTGVTGHNDVLKHTKVVASKLRGIFGFVESPQPVAKLSEYRP